MPIMTKTAFCKLYAPVDWLATLLDLDPESSVFKQLSTPNLQPRDIENLEFDDATTRSKVDALLKIHRYWTQSYVRETPVNVTTPEDVVAAYGPILRDLQHEEFHVLLLDNGGNIIDHEIISRGIANAALVHPREVFRPAIRKAASSIILMHNHPSGTREASKEDHLITKQIVKAGRIIDITVHDHIIICGGSYVSFTENGWLI